MAKPTYQQVADTLIKFGLNPRDRGDVTRFMEAFESDLDSGQRNGQPPKRKSKPKPAARTINPRLPCWTPILITSKRRNNLSQQRPARKTAAQ